MLSEQSMNKINESIGTLKQPVRMVLFTADVGCDTCPAMVDLSRALKARSNLLALEIYDKAMDRDKTDLYGIKATPALVIQAADGKFVTLYGRVDDTCLDVLLATINGVSISKEWFPQNIVRTLSHLTNDVAIRVLADRDCKQCVPVIETAIGLGFTNALVSTSIFMSRDFPEMMKRYAVAELPKTIFGENLHLDGHVTEGEFLEMIFQAEGIKTGPEKRCLICGSSTPDVICNSCKTKIQAEAVDHKFRGERLRSS